MTHPIRWSLALVALAVLSACNQKATEPAAPTQAPAPAPAVEQAPAAQGQPAPATEGYALSMAKVEAYFKAQQQLALAAQADPKFEDLSMNISREDTAQYTARLEANDKVRAIITDAGLSTRDFALTGETLLSALLAEAAMDAGSLKQLPEGIDPASVEFVKQNKAQIEALMKASAGSGGE